MGTYICIERLQKLKGQKVVREIEIVLEEEEEKKDWLKKLGETKERARKGDKETERKRKEGWEDEGEKNE